MNVNIVGIGMSIGSELKQKVEKKLEKYDKFFSRDCHCQIKFTVIKGEVKAEITIKAGPNYYRAENKANDALLALDGAADRLERRIRKQKTRIKKRKHEYLLDSYFEADVVEAELDPDEAPATEVVFARRKAYSLEPMEAEDAVIRMELVGHNFFIFRNVETDEINVVYRRTDGDYGIMEPAKED